MRKICIYALTLSALPNDKHIAVIAFMAEALRMYSIAETNLDRFVEIFFDAYEKENKAFMRIDRKELTKKMNEADIDRINALRILRDALKILLIVKNAEKNAAAERILDVIDLYGGSEIYNQPVDARTGNITNIIEDLESDLAASVRILELENVVENLKTANQLFLQRQSERNMSDAEFGKSTLAEARVESDNIWRALVGEVNNAIAYGTAEEREALVPFAKYMNVEIDKYRIQTGQGVGGSTSSGSSNEEEEGPRMRTATFKFHNGNVIKLRLEVGAPLEAPENTLGYLWKPDVSEFMPDKNVTYNEVPMTAEEVTATFHFFDHREEEIKQLVGSILHAPTNTVGYHWDPEVPATMPAEDTAYYEQPDAEQQPTKYTITFTHNGQTVGSMELEAGATVTPPAAPTGYHWVNVPATMPAENVTIQSEADEQEPPSLT